MDKIISLRKRLMSLATMCFFPFFTVHGAMTVYPMETEIGKNGTAQIKVLSQSDEVQFIKISVKKIINPGVQGEKEVESNISTEQALIVTPQKLVLTAGSERIVRLVSLTPQKYESTWRVYFEEVSENVFKSELEGRVVPKKRAEVGVSIIWGALIHVAPSQPEARLACIIDSNNVVNTGTLRLQLKEFAICNASGECQWRNEKTTVYPGTSVRILGERFSSEYYYRVKYYNWMKNVTEEIELPACQVN